MRCKWGMGRAVLAGAMLATGSAWAQSNPWDPVISNSNWYVTVPQMLAYASGTTSFINPLAIGDQTLWALGTSVNGVFSGTSTGQLLIGNTYSYSTLSIQGSVTASGQILMVFTPTSGPTTIGLGQMADRGGAYEMEMQMITGSSVLVTHWAYMTSYDPATFTPPAAQHVESNASPNWKWMAGTPWRMNSPGLFGSPGQGNLVVTNYDGGYFWGVAVAPGGASAGVFTVLGSVTPEGRVLLNTISAGQLYSLYGGVVGSPAEAAMLLGAYDSSGAFTGEITRLTLVQPYSATVLRQGNPAAFGAATALYGVASTLDGLFGPLAPALAVLNGLEGPALSTAISQTLPVLNGAGAQATFATQRALQQVVMSRIDAVHGADAAGAERNIWLRPFGAFASQGTVSGVSGYSASGGGMAAGVDGAIGTGGVIGAVVAYSGTSITGGNSLVPNSLDVSTWQMGLYGAQALGADVDLAWQLDLGVNRNTENRTIAFMGTGASAAYDGWTGHAGLALSRRFELAPDFAVSPLLRIDYAQVQADGYTESGAGPLDLTVPSQTYRELMLGAGMKASYRLAPGLLLTGNAGVGYNTLNNQVQVVTTYAGGGGPFVTEGLDVSPWLYTAGIGLAGLKAGRMELGLNYDIEASTTGFLNQIGSVLIRMKL